MTNKYSQGLEVTDIKISTPRFITAAVAPTRLQIPYGEAGVVAVDVIVAKQIVPGKYPIVVVASLKTANGLSGSVVKSQEIDIGVLGESDLLSKIGAPSMLFLPGVLFLLAWQLLWSIGKTAAERTAYSLPPTVGGFWVVAVAIAFIVARLYPSIALAVTGEAARLPRGLRLRRLRLPVRPGHRIGGGVLPRLAWSAVAVRAVQGVHDPLQCADRCRTFRSTCWRSWAASA